jgi:hypothetical protein
LKKFVAGSSKKGESIVKLEPLRSLQSKLSIAFLAAAALVLASCGGGGATSSPTIIGSLQILPGTASIYAGVPYTFTIAGGRKPYLVTSSEQTLVALNYTTDSNDVTIVANNPGVVDPGLQANEVPRRSVNIQVRDSVGVSTTVTYSVLLNLFFGYSQSYSTDCFVSGATTQPQACSGSDTLVQMFPTSQGVLYGNREFLFERVRGDFSFVQETPNAVPASSARVRTGQDGLAFMRIRVNNDAPTQIASYRITDVATNTTITSAFLITGVLPGGSITLVPGAAITFTGGSTAACGFGSSDQLVFDGTPPYTITPPANIGVNPLTILKNGDKFTVTVGQGAPVTACPSGTVVIIDSVGRRATLSVTSLVGTVSTPITVAPLPLPNLTCTANTSQAAVVGGNGPLQVVSTHPRVFATISGNVLSVIRAPNGDGATVYPATANLVVTDGATINTAAITFTVSANCP